MVHGNISAVRTFCLILVFRTETYLLVVWWEQVSVLISDRGAAVLSGFIFAQRALPNDRVNDSKGSSSKIIWDDITVEPYFQANPYRHKSNDLNHLGSLMCQVRRYRLSR